jgi:hypothetical protein
MDKVVMLKIIFYDAEDKEIARYMYTKNEIDLDACDLLNEAYRQTKPWVRKALNKDKGE